MNIDPGQIDPTTPTGQIIGGGVGVSALVWAFFHIRRMLRMDKGEANGAAAVVKQDEREDKYLSRLEARMVELEKRADDAFAQRNVAIEGEAKESARAMVAEEKLASEVGALTRELETIKASRQKTKEKLAELDVAILQVKLKLATVEREKAILVSALISAKADHGLTLAEDVDALLSPRRRAEDDTTTPVPRSPATNTAWASGIPGDGDE